MFKIGEVVIMHGLKTHAWLNGMECIITTGLYREFYGISIRGEPEWEFARVHNLKRKEPPGSELAILVSAALFDRLTAKQPA